MAALVSFILERNNEQVETVHSTQANEFTRIELMKKFVDFLKSVGYVFPEEDTSKSEQQEFNFEME